MVDAGYDAAFDDPYLYKGTSVLKNRIGIRDPDELEAFEVEMTTLRASEPLPSGSFDAKHYRRIHKHLFQDVYSWAGQDRTVRLAKGGSHFCYPENLKAQMGRVFKVLADTNTLRGRDFAGFVEGAANFFGELNATHPFRDGNGRSQLAFLHLLAIDAGHPLALERVKRQPFIKAMVASFNGDLHPLVAQLTALEQ